MASIGVIGAGVMGTCGAEALQEQGHNVTIYSPQKPKQTLSQQVPPAIVLPCVAEWTQQPNEVQRGMEQLFAWEHASLKRFQQESDKSNSGVAPCKAVMIFDESVHDNPYWKEDYPDFRYAEEGELPEGFSSGWAFTTYIINTRRWLGNITNNITKEGGKIQEIDQPFTSIEEVIEKHPGHDAWLVAPGIGAATLFPEDEENIYGSRGRLVEVEIEGTRSQLLQQATIHAPESVEFKNPHKFEYIVPVHGPNGTLKEGRFILGGTMEPVSAEELITATPYTVDTSGKLSSDVYSEVHDKCLKLVPDLKGARIVTVREGIRPCRKGGIRIEAVDGYDKPVIAAYGAASDGISVHGCMKTVVDISNLLL